MSPGRRNFSLKSARIPAKKLLASGQNPSLLDTLLFFKQALKPEQRKQIKTFVARLFGLSSYETAKNLAYDFGIDAVIASQSKYHLEYCNNVTNAAGRRVRGFWGIEALVHPNISVYSGNSLRMYVPRDTPEG